MNHIKFTAQLYISEVECIEMNTLITLNVSQSGVLTLISITTLQAIDARYTEVAARVGSDQEVTFEGEQITLDIPKEGIVLESGWTITPHTYPGVSLMLLYCLLTALSTELHSLLLLLYTLCIETADYGYFSKTATCTTMLYYLKFCSNCSN